jgi:AraC-like DNA-binding protein
VGSAQRPDPVGGGCDSAGVYREWDFGIDGAVVWTRDPLAEARESRVLPDGCMDLIWSQGRVFVAGPDTLAWSSITPAGAQYVAVRFAPGLAPAVLGLPADALRDAQHELDEIWPRRGRRLADQITGAADRPAAMADFVRAELARACSDPMVAEVARRLRRGESVERVAAAVGYSSRQLRRRSFAAFGYGPKTLARVLRFDRALRLARRGLALAEVAARVGYADQAHLTREVRALAGMSPTELLRG